MALIAPAVIPPTIATIKDNKHSCAEVGMHHQLYRLHYGLQYLNDGPKSPCNDAT